MQSTGTFVDTIKHLIERVGEDDKLAFSDPRSTYGIVTTFGNGLGRPGQNNDRWRVWPRERRRQSIAKRRRRRDDYARDRAVEFESFIHRLGLRLGIEGAQP